MTEQWEKVPAPFRMEGLRATWKKNERGTTYHVEAETLRSFPRIGKVTVSLGFPASMVEGPRAKELIEERLGAELHERVTLEAMEG